MATQVDIGLARNAPAVFLGAGDQILVHRARIGLMGVGSALKARLVGRARAGQRTGGNDIGAAIVIVAVPVGGKIQLQLAARIIEQLAAQAAVLVSVDLELVAVFVMLPSYCPEG
jgi:hypothetical protein